MKSVIQIIFKTFLLSLLVAGQVNFIYAQTASILPPAKTTFFDQNGKPLTSGKVQFYIPGTTTPKTTWQDSGETIPNTNPVILDAEGRAIILGDGSYRQIVKDRLGNLIWDQQTSSTGTGGGGTTATVGDGDAVGTVKPWSGFIAPSQYVFSYGQELARASFPLLLSTLTSQQNVSCTSGSPTLTSVGDTSQLPIGAPVESICLNAGATIVSTTISTVTVSSNAIISTNSSARFFPFGNGDGSLTFNTPDLRGRVLAGRDNMGGVAASRLTNSSTGFGVIAALGAVGGQQSVQIVTANTPPYTPSGSVSTSTGSNLINGGFQVVISNGGSNTPSTGPNQTISGAITPTFTSTSTFTGTAQGGTSTPFTNVPPTEIINYIIKTLPDTNANSFFGVASIGGMFGVLTCGTGITCAGNQISAVSSVVPPPSVSTLGGVFSLTCSTSNWFRLLDTTGTFGCSQPNFTDLVGTISLAQLGIVPLSNGGTGSNITPNNGGIFWSNATVAQLLAGTAIARLPLLSGASATPVWGTFTLPSTVISGGVACFTSTSAMGSSVLETANAIMLGGGAGACPSPLGSLGTTTTLLHGNASGAPSFTSIVPADLPLATNAAIGGMRGDTSTISCVSGVCSSVGSAATAVTLLTTTVTGGTSGQMLSITNTGCSATTPCLTQFLPPILDATPTNPTGLTAVGMLGVGSTCKITPILTGRIHIDFWFNYADNSSTTLAALGKYGTGTAPANAAAVTGTSFGSNLSLQAGAGGITYFASTGANISGLTVGTQVWLDLAITTLPTGTATVSNLHCSAQEL